MPESLAVEASPAEAVPGSRRSPTARVVGQVVLGYAIAASLIPVNPSMPVLGLDPSWMLAINRATAQHLRFGSEIVFTYGPYGGLITGVYEPGIRPLMLGSAVVLTAGFVVATLLALRRAGTWVHLAAAAAIVMLTSVVVQSLDTIVLVYPLVVVFAVPRLPDEKVPRLAAVAALALPLGLLPLAKLSLVPAIGAALLAAALLLYRRRDWAGIAVLGVAPVASALYWWTAAGQPLAGMAGYVRGSWYLIAGYSEAMASHESSQFPAGLVTLTFLAASVVVIAFGLTAWREGDWLIQMMMAAATLFLVFKAGFVRADTHMQAGALGLVATASLVGLLGPWQRAPRWRVASAVVTTCAMAAAFVCYKSGPVTSPVTALRSRTTALAGAVFGGDVSSGSLHRRYDTAMSEIQRAWGLPPAEGTADLYVASVNLLLAQGAAWDPRPVFQSYSAFRPELAAMNARHLEGPAAPRTIYLQIGPIDGRLAGLEDGASWLPIVENYDLAQESNGYLVLRRRDSPRPAEVAETPEVLHSRIGALLPIAPSDGSNWLATFHVRPTLAGKLRTALWKPPQLAIEIHTSDGAVDVRRFIPSMARSEFILSPYVSDTTSFRSLFPDQSTLVPSRQVTAIRLLVESPDALHYWDGAYSVRLRALRVTP